MKKTRKISGLLSVLLLAWGSVNAAGLGKLTVQSALGQPLKAEIELLSVTKDELADITAKLASADAFRQARIDRQETLRSLNFSVDQRANGQPVIRITSSVSVPDPYLDMLIELNWSSGRLIREYTILLDPPASAKPLDVARPAVQADSSRNGASQPVDQPDAARQKTAAPAKAPATPERYGPVKAGETLRGIAGKLKPADVSLDQMMASLYQANKTAFQSNNMNRLSRGRVLNVPDADAAMVLTRAQATKLVQGHTTEWHAYRRKLAEMAGESAVPEVADQAAGKITQKEDAKPAPAQTAPKDVLKLSKGEPSGAGKSDARTLERMRAMEEEVAAKGRALQEAQDRVTQLERTVRDMQKLLELKAQEAAKAPPAPPAPVVAPPAPVAETPPPETEPAPPPVEKPKPKPAPVAVPMPVQPPSPSWISTFISNPIYIGGIVAALLLSALLWMMMVGSRRRQGLTKFEDSIMTGGEFKNNAVFTASTGNVASGAATEGSMLLTDFSRLGMGAIDSHEVDPIAEAEVYMAYGRDAQAEEILREALVKDPSRYEIALKLLELYASRKDATNFETTASELYAGLGGQNTPVWQRAAEMGRSIDPQNPLYRVAAPSAESAAAPVAAAVAAAPVVAAAAAAVVAKPVEAVKPTMDFGDLEQLASMDDWGSSTAPVVEESAPSAPAMEFAASPVPETPAVADDNLMEFESVATAPEFSLPEADASDLGSLAQTADSQDFDLDLAAPQAEPEPAAGQPEAGVLEIPEDMGLEFESATDFDAAPSIETEPVAETIEALAADDLSALDLSDSFDSEEIQATSAEEMPVLDLSGIDLELDVEPADAGAADFEPAPALPSEPELVAEPVAEPTAVEEESEIDPELREEVNTKLDLARAYMEMGDREGAREILQEVLGEGDKQQKAEADKLMAEAA